MSVVEPSLTPAKALSWPQIAGLVMLMIAEIAVRAFSVMLFWRWFVIAPDGPFEVLPALSYVHAVGIVILAKAFTSLRSANLDQPWGEQLTYPFLYAALILVTGLVAHLLLS